MTADESQPCVLPDHPQPTTATRGLLCARHYHWMLGTLTELENLWALRGYVLLPGPATGARSATPDGSPAPGRLAVMAMSDRRGIRDWHDDPDAIPDVPGVLYSWVRMIGEELERDPGTDGTLVSSVRFLRQWRLWIARQLWVDDYAVDLASLHRVLAVGVGDSMWPRSLGSCPNCGAAIYPTIGVDVVSCRRCRSTWEGVHLVRLRLVLEQQEGSQVSASHALQ